MKSRTAFAALGNDMEKQAFLQGLKDMGSGAMEYAGNKAKALGAAATTGIRSVGAGLGAGLTGGGLRGAADAMDSTWNAGQQKAQQFGAAAEAGKSRAAGGLGTAMGGAQNVAQGATAYAGNSLAAPSKFSTGLKSVGSALGAGLSGGGLRGAADAMDNTWNAGMARAGQHNDAADAGWNRMTAGIGATPTPAGTPAANPATPTAPAPAAPTSTPFAELATSNSALTPPAVGTAAPAGGIAAPVTQPAAPVTPSAPSPGQLKQFQQGTATPYNPKSPLDAAKMNGLMSGQRNWAANDWARGQMGKSAFAMLEKEAAGGLAGAAVKGLRGAGKSLLDWGRRAKGGVRQKALDAGQDSGEAAVAARGVGNKRRDLGRTLEDKAYQLNNSPGAQKAINVGGGAVLGGGALVGSNRLGHSSGVAEGRAKGVNEGFDAGTQAGIASAEAAMPGDPGLLGRIGQVFTGGGGGVNTGLAQERITGARDSIIQSILAGQA